MGRREATASQTGWLHGLDSFQKWVDLSILDYALGNVLQFYQYQKYVFPCLLWVVSKIIQVPSPCMLEVPISNRPCSGANLTLIWSAKVCQEMPRLCAQVWSLDESPIVNGGFQLDSTMTITGWWFGTLILFFHILGIILPTDFHIFQRGWNHQPDNFATMYFKP